MKNFFLHIYIIGSLLLLGGCARHHKPDAYREAAPQIYPDYTNVVFPCNIAPPNFVIKEEGTAYQAEIGYGAAVKMIISNDEPTIRIPAKQWKQLLQEAKGEDIFFRISVLQGEKWTGYADIVNRISTHPIDPCLVYRLLYPGYELWNEMGIYQRDLTSHEQTPVVENRDFGRQCVNCHSFSQHSPENMMLHIRGKDGGTLIYKNGKVEKTNLKPEGFKNGATYPSWNPDGRYLAFSMNEVQQFFHSAGKKMVEVSDLESDIVIYDTETNRIFTDSLVYTTAYMETFPTWSPDGENLYFCRAKAYRKDTSLDSIRYDLYRIRFDKKQERLYDLECVYEASSIGKSVSHPRISPNGKYLMFTQSDYGNFSIWHAESDLFLLELETKQVRALDEVNSNDVDSYHTWSSSGYWFVFSSKRLDTLWARPFFAAFDPETGRAGKPFLLPQEDPEFYNTCTYTFNVPELITAPIKNQRQLLDGTRKRAKTVNN